MLHPFDKGFSVGMMYISVCAATDCNVTLTVTWRASGGGNKYELQQAATRTATADSRSIASVANLSNNAGDLDGSSGSNAEQHGSSEDQSFEDVKLTTDSKAGTEGGENQEQLSEGGQGDGEPQAGKTESAADGFSQGKKDGVADGYNPGDDAQQLGQDAHGMKGLDDGKAWDDSPGANEACTGGGHGDSASPEPGDSCHSTYAGVNDKKKNSNDVRNGSKLESNARNSGTSIKLVHAKTTEDLRGMDWQSVCAWLKALDISEQVINKVTEEKVPGEQLRAMSVDEMKLDLGMSSLQAKRVAMNMLQ